MVLFTREDVFAEVEFCARVAVAEEALQLKPRHTRGGFSSAIDWGLDNVQVERQ